MPAGPHFGEERGQMVVPLVERHLGGDLAAGVVVILPTWVVQRDPRWFDEPEAFRPERWADERAHPLPRFAYFPFGGGPRQCIGNAFAMMEAVLLLATILSPIEVAYMMSRNGAARPGYQPG